MTKLNPTPLFATLLSFSMAIGCGDSGQTTAGGGGDSSSGGNTQSGGSSTGGVPSGSGGSLSGSGGTSTGLGGEIASTGGTSPVDVSCGAGRTPTVTVTNSDELVAAFASVAAGDVISIAEGTYLLSGKNLKLAVDDAVVFGVEGKTLLDFEATATNNKPGLDVTGSGNTVCGLTIARAPDNGIHITGDDNTIDRCEFYECFDSGLQISGPQAETPPHPANNLILNCDSHDNYDTSASGGNADGFAAKINIGPGNKFVGCVAHDNSDDGWDTFPKTTSGTNPVTIENSIAYHNGYHGGEAAGNGNGFKVGSDVTGGAAHVLKNSCAFDNPSKGFDQNHNEGVASLDHCAAVGNDRNVAFQEFDGANITNTVAEGGWEQAAGTDTGNVKDAVSDDFESLDPSLISRDLDGTLHLNGFCVYSKSSAGAHF